MDGRGGSEAHSQHAHTHAHSQFTHTHTTDTHILGTISQVQSVDCSCLQTQALGLGTDGQCLLGLHWQPYWSVVGTKGGAVGGDQVPHCHHQLVQCIAHISSGV